MATKKKAKAKAGSRPPRLIFEESGSPIIIGGGGSVGVDFDHRHYPPTTAGDDPPRYQDPTAKREIGGVLILNKHAHLLSFSGAGVKSNCLVQLTTDSGDDIATVSSTDTEGIAVTFARPTHYKRDASKSNVHYNSSDKLGHVEVVIDGTTRFSGDLDSRAYVLVINRSRA